MTPEAEAAIDRECERIMNLSDTELRAEIRASGEDPDEMAARVELRIATILSRFERSRGRLQ